MGEPWLSAAITHADMRRLGKLAPRPIARLPALASYTVSLPLAPASIDWTGKVQKLGMFGNDRLGDCTCCAAAHLVQIWTSLTGSQAPIADADVLGMYEGACGYEPGKPDTDQGGIETDVLTWWTKNPLAGHSIDAFAKLNSRLDLMDAVWLFGGAYIGLDLPLTAQDGTWDVPSGGPVGDAKPGSWGGHAVAVVGYDTEGVTISTWDELKRASWVFVDTYCDEAYAVLSRDWTGQAGKAPSGFDYGTLQADMPAFS